MRELEEERDFLLGSIADLDVEAGAGDIDPDDYEVLRHDYTVRAAATIRAIESAGRESTQAIPANAPHVEETEQGPAAPSPAARWVPVRRRRPLLILTALVVVGAGVAYLVVASSRPRLAGETITGANVATSPAAISQVPRLLDAARSAEVHRDAVGELADVRAVLAADPTQPQALTLEGWLLVQTQRSALVSQGIGLLRLAEELDPTLAEVHAYLAISLLDQGNDAAAVPELHWYLTHHPDRSLVARFRSALAQAEQRSAPPASRSPAG